ncbi:DUF2283 domain-containing protein [Nanoarchaeota archaeon]
MKSGIDIYYDDEGDFLEITMMPVPEDSYCEDISEDVFVRKNSETNEIVGIGILNFRLNSGKLREILSKIPVKASFESLV